MYNKKTYLIAIDKFKGSISAKGAAECLSKGLMIASPMYQSIIHPISDGGEGTLDILAFHLGLDIHEVMVADPLNPALCIRITKCSIYSLNFGKQTVHPGPSFYW